MLSLRILIEVTVILAAFSCNSWQLTKIIHMQLQLAFLPTALTTCKLPQVLFCNLQLYNLQITQSHFSENWGVFDGGGSIGGMGQDRERLRNEMSRSRQKGVMYISLPNLFPPSPTPGWADNSVGWQILGLQRLTSHY